MWILECEGDILNNKRVWLRPDKTYLFGRTKPENSRYQTGFRINHKTVSRKHLTITVASSGVEDVGVISKRTELTFEDAGTKAGTKIDGERINSGSKKVSSGVHHSFTLSSYEHAFHVTWKPVVLSFTFSSKDTKGGKDPLQPIHARLAGLDIKAIANYAATKTTHVVASKRNTARGLQALIQGARIVTDHFVDMIVAAATPSDLDAPESFAPLEEDFDAGWPEEVAFLPPPGREPGAKDPELFEPDAERVDIFKGMIFVFCDNRQFEALQPPITDAGGKATLFNLIPGETTAQELKRYIKNLAGEKDDGQLDDDNRVVAVKFGGPKDHEDWANQLQHDLALAIGYRLMEQNEFLDAILTKNVAKLSRRLEPGDVPEPALMLSTSANTDSSARPSEAPDSSAEAKPEIVPRRRGKIASAFSGFDADFDPSEIQSAIPRHVSRDTQERSPAPGESTRSEVSTSQDERPNGRASRKRAPSESTSDIENVEARMFPATAMMKRRRLERGESTNSHDDVTSENNRDKAGVENSRSSTAAPVEGKKTVGSKRVKKETDIAAAARAHREAWDATRAREEEEEGVAMAGLEDMSVSQMKKLAVVEALEVSDDKLRNRQPLAESKNGHRGNENGSRQWREEWNGRKNFKGFRPQGHGKDAARRGGGQALIIPLEEVKRKESGVGEGYWGTGGSSSIKSATSRYKQRIRSRWEDEAEDTSEDEDGGKVNGAGRFGLAHRSRASATQRSKTSRIGEVNEIPASVHEQRTTRPEEMVEIDDDDGGEEADDGSEEVERTHARLTRSNGLGATQRSGSRLETQRPGSSKGPPAKRSATHSSGEKSAPPKRQKRLDEAPARRSAQRADDNDDDDDGSGDELKFKFRRRK